MKPDLLILCATELEAIPFLDQVQDLNKTNSPIGRVFYRGTLNETVFELLITGIGVFNTAQALTAFIESNDINRRPELIVQAGIAGVYKDSGFEIGSIAIATKEHYLHTGIASGSIQNSPLPFDLIDDEPDTRSGAYLFNSQQVEQCMGVLSQAGWNDSDNITTGPFITVSTITASLKTASLISNAFMPVMEAMEGAAAAHIARLYEIPMLEIRTASNYAGDRDKQNWKIELAVKKMALSLNHLIQSGFFLDP